MKEIFVDFISSSIVIRQFDGCGRRRDGGKRDAGRCSFLQASLVIFVVVLLGTEDSDLVVFGSPGETRRDKITVI